MFIPKLSSHLLLSKSDNPISSCHQGKNSEQRCLLFCLHQAKSTISDCPHQDETLSAAMEFC